MYTIDSVYHSVITWATAIAPSGVTIMGGEEAGIRVAEPSGVVPSVAIELDDIVDDEIELGSYATSCTLRLVVTARSRVQRDALMTIYFNALRTQVIPLYDHFNGTTPSGGIVRYAESRSVVANKIPNFSTDREKFFWTAAVVSDVVFLGT